MICSSIGRAVFLFLLGILILSFRLFPNPEYRSYPLSLDYTADFQSLEPLDSVVTAYRVFFSGEAHNIAGNQQRHFKLFAYLHKRAGVRYYVKEGSYTYVYFVNRYVQTGQEQWLDSAFVAIRQAGADSAGKPVAEKVLWQQLYKLNMSAPDNQKIQLVAIDTDPYWTMSMLRDLRNRHPHIPPQLQGTLHELLALRPRYPFRIMELDRRDRQRFEPILGRAREVITKHEDLARAWLGEDFRHLEVLLDNPAAFSRNERSLYSNFVRLRQNLPPAGYFLQYGRLHAQLNTTSFTERWLANLVNQETPVLSILPFYINCQAAWSMLPYPDTRWLSRAQQNQLRKAAGPSSHSLYFTQGANNPLKSLSPYGQVFIVEKDIHF